MSDKSLEPDAIWDGKGRLVYTKETETVPPGFAEGFRRGFDDATRDFVARNEARNRTMEESVRSVESMIRSGRINLWNFAIVKDGVIYKNPRS